MEHTTRKVRIMPEKGVNCVVKKCCYLCQHYSPNTVEEYPENIGWCDSKFGKKPTDDPCDRFVVYKFLSPIIDEGIE